MTTTADLLVIGGGAAGLTAAREGARRGARTVLVQDGLPGGECTFSGCVPSKALLAAAVAPDPTWAKARHAIDRSIATIAATEDVPALRGEGIEVVTGRATLGGPGAVVVDGTVIHAPHIIIATGSAPALPSVPGLDTIAALTNESVFQLDTQPASLVVLGGGPIGCEMAQAFSRLGTAVTIIEQAPGLLPRDEPEAAAVIQRSLQARGVTVKVATTVTRAEQPSPTTRRLHLSDGTTVDADQVLVAAGRRPITSGLALEAAGVDVDERGYIRVDDTMATSRPGIWAIGDVTGTMQLTHAAGRMAYVAVANATRSRLDPRRARFDPQVIPWATFTDPEVAHIGLREADAASIPGALVAFLPLAEVDRAVTSDRTDGFVKLIAGPRRLLRSAGGGSLLGASIVAPRAGEMIHEIALAMTTNMFTGRLAQTTHAYPTWSMAIQQAALQFFFESGGRRAVPAARDGSANWEAELALGVPVGATRAHP